MDNSLEQKYKALYQRLFDLIDTVHTIPCQDWSTAHVLAYVMRKYKEKYNVEYKLSYNNVPSKCYEYSLISRLKMILKKNDIKDYIDWFYENYKGKNKFRSVGALTKVELVIQYEEYKTNKNKVTTYTPLPENIINVAKNYPELEYISTYGDLYFIYKSDKNILNPLSNVLDINILENIS